MSVENGKWQLKRNDTNEVLLLHSQYDWADEYDWSSLAQSAPMYGINGSQFIFQGVKKAGRPITLDGTYTQISRADMAIIQTWASVPKLTMTLTHPNATEYQVIFSRPFLTDRDGKQIKPADQSADDKMQVNISFITV